MTRKRFHPDKLLLLCALLLSALLLFAACASNDPAPAPEPDPQPTVADQEPPVVADEPDAEPVELLIAAAASLAYAAEDLTELYQTVAPHVTLTYTFGGSGALQTQIEEGAPADVFFSAAQTQMNALEEGGYLLEGSRVNLLENKVVLIVPAGSEIDLASFEDVASDAVTMIALGEPGSVPVGQYAEEIFDYLGILDVVQAKANYGSDVTQVLTWVSGGNVECGVVYATDAATTDQVTVVTAAPEGSHSPVIYPVSVLKESAQAAEAQAFVDFLGSAEAAAIFASYGFSIVN